MATITGGALATAKKNLKALKDAWAAQQDDPDAPKVGSKEDYDKLVAAVEESTRKNESIAQLKSRVQALGASVVKIATTFGII